MSSTQSHECGCASSTPMRYNAQFAQALLAKASERHQAKIASPDVQVSLLPTGSNLSLEILSTDEKDKSSLIVFQKAGSFHSIELKLNKFDVSYPKADIELYFKIDPFDGGPFKIEGTLMISCSDISHPSSCTVSYHPGNTAPDVSMLVNWECLKSCAPQCISCGGNWQCWLGCAGGCIFQCL